MIVIPDRNDHFRISASKVRNNPPFTIFDSGSGHRDAHRGKENILIHARVMSLSSSKKAFSPHETIECGAKRASIGSLTHGAAALIVFRGFQVTPKVRIDFRMPSVSLSVVIPVYNEAENIRPLIEQLNQALADWRHQVSRTRAV